MTAQRKETSLRPTLSPHRVQKRDRVGSPDLDVVVIKRVEHAREVKAHSAKRLHHHARVPGLNQQLFGERDVKEVEHVLRATSEGHGRPLQQELG